MTEQEAVLTLAGRRQDRVDDPALAERAAAAREAVAARDGALDQQKLARAAPGELAEHVQKLREHPKSAGYFNEGWNVELVDLSRVCSLQQTIRSADAVERVVHVDAADALAVAAVTLPEPGEKTELPIQFDELRQTWLISAPNPNLKIAGHWAGEVEGNTAFGFFVTVMPSFLQVAKHHGRYVLRDGYHRAYGLLARGISEAPAFVRDFGMAPLGLGPGFFGTDVYLGQRPPLVTDFLDDAVAADVQIPGIDKMVVLQGLELTPLSYLGSRLW
jgi:hypothetical protein